MNFKKKEKLSPEKQKNDRSNGCAIPITKHYEMHHNSLRQSPSWLYFSKQRYISGLSGIWWVKDKGKKIEEEKKLRNNRHIIFIAGILWDASQLFEAIPITCIL